MNEIAPYPRIPEVHIRDAIYNFFAYGFSPGSYTTYMLLHQYEKARMHAHPNLLQNRYTTYTMHDYLVAAVQKLPSFFTGENFKSWPGYVHLSVDEQEKIRRPYYGVSHLEYETYCAIEDPDNNPVSFRVWIDLTEGKVS